MNEPTLLLGDCLELLPTLEAASVDAVVTDPPYGLEFMGKDWDGSDGFRRSLNAADAGRESVFGRTSAKAPEYRTSGAGQKSAPGIGERQTDWVSNQGWNAYRCKNCGHLPHGGSPCSCDKPEMVRADNRWHVFQEWCEQWARECLRVLKPGGYLLAFGGSRTWHRLASAVEDAGFEIRDSIAWLYGSGFPKSLNLGEGRGTALKPAFEPIVMGRKPLMGTVAANVLTHGVGALNIDASRINTNGEQVWAHRAGNGDPVGLGKPETMGAYRSGDALKADRGGRWPANVVLDEAMADVLDEQAPNTGGGSKDNRGQTHGFVEGRTSVRDDVFTSYGDRGGASRFYYIAKAGQAERPKLDDAGHPTVKPLDLMRWLIRLVTPPGGVVLDPFLGSGTTAEACLIEGFRCIGIERDETYLALAKSRLAKPISPVLDFGVVTG